MDTIGGGARPHEVTARSQGGTVMRVEPVSLALLRGVRLPQQSWPTSLSPHSPGHRAMPGIHPPCPPLAGPLQVPWQACSLCARLCASVHCKGDSDTLRGIWRQEENRPPDTSGAGISGCLLRVLTLTRPFSPASWVTDDKLQLPGLFPGSAKDLSASSWSHPIFRCSSGAGASGSECRPSGWNPPSGSSCTED